MSLPWLEQVGKDVWVLVGVVTWQSIARFGAVRRRGRVDIFIYPELPDGFLLSSSDKDRVVENGRMGRRGTSGSDVLSQTIQGPVVKMNEIACHLIDGDYPR